jgi:hypothetical protein
MKKQKRFLLGAVATVVFIILYIILAAKPLQNELQLDPQWTITIGVDENTSTGRIISEQKTLLPFKLGQVMGYFTPEGELRQVTHFPYKAVISEHYYASFEENAEDTVFYTKDGNVVGTIKGSGFPYFDSDRVYLFHPAGSSFSKCDDKGNILWTHEEYLPFLAF